MAKKILSVCFFWIVGALIIALGLTCMNTAEAMPQDGATWVLYLGSTSLTLAGMVCFFGVPLVILKDI